MFGLFCQHSIAQFVSDGLTGANGGTPAAANQDTIVVKAELTGSGSIAAQSSSVKIELNYQQVS